MVQIRIIKRMLIHSERANQGFVGQALGLASNSATDPPPLYYGATSPVALQLKNAQNPA
jgi:hypothetical protein